MTRDTATTLAVLVVVYAVMAIEARRASRNERVQRARGGIEPEGDVYAAMRVVYPGLFLVMAAESAWRGSAPAAWLVLGLGTLAVAKALKWWAIVTLRECWTFRIIVVPGMARVRGGPYRFLPHPNYVGVIGELVGAALLLHARWTGPAAVLVFGWLIVRRLAVEQQAIVELMHDDASRGYHTDAP